VVEFYVAQRVGYGRSGSEFYTQSSAYTLHLSRYHLINIFPKVLTELYYFNILKMCTRRDPINHSI